VVTFALREDSYALITGETGRAIHRSHHGLTIGAEEWQALQRAAHTDDGKYVVQCDERAARSLLEWFEQSFEVAKSSHGLFGEPSSVLSSCRHASAAIRGALAAPGGLGGPLGAP